jgi:hypothetical protein
MVSSFAIGVHLMASIPQDLTRYAEAILQRVIDRAKPECDWPEIAVIGEPSEALALATLLRRAKIATATYGKIKRALQDDPDYVLYADTLAIRCQHTGVRWFLNRDDPVTGALFAVNCGYLPIDWDRLELKEAA